MRLPKVGHDGALIAKQLKMLFTKNEIPKEMYDKLLEIMLSSKLSYNIYDAYPPNPLDIKTILMLKNNSIFFAGRHIQLEIGSPTRIDDLFVVDAIRIAGSSSKNNNDFMFSFISNDVVKSRLSGIMDIIASCEEFKGNGNLPYMCLYISICNICECVVIGSDQHIMMRHLELQHCDITYNPVNYYGLVDYVTKQGDCVKCGKTYEIFADNPSLILTLKKFSNSSIHLTVGRWCKYDQTAKIIVQNHILECFCANRIPYEMDKCIEQIMSMKSVKYSSGSCQCGCEYDTSSSESTSSEESDESDESDESE